MFDPGHLALILHQDWIDLLAAIIAFAGLCTCLLGLRIWRGILAVAGLIVGSALGSYIAYQQGPGKMIVVVGLGIAAGCVLMVLASWLHQFTTMIIFAAIGWYLGMKLGAQLGVPASDLFVCSIGGALVMGIAAILFEMPGIVLLSSVAGAWATVWAVSLYWDSEFCQVIDAMTLYLNRDQYGMELLCAGLLTLLGFLLQGIGWLRAGPDMKQLEQAVDYADMPKKRRVSILEDLRTKGAITRSEYFRHMVRILSGA
jgi:hypothetical protein